MVKAHIFVDFQGFGIAPEDMTNFFPEGSACPYNEEGRGRQSTIYVGQRLRTHGCVYDKTRELAAKRVNDEESNWRPIWEQSPGFDVADPVQRVEWRAMGPDLRVEDSNGVVFDLSKPATLRRADARAVLWTYLCRRFRLTVPGRTRRKRWPVDPRWRIVQEVAGLPDRRVTRSRNAERHRLEGQRKYWTDGLVRAAVRLCFLRGERDLSPEALESTISDALRTSKYDVARYSRQVEADFAYLQPAIAEARHETANDEPPRVMRVIRGGR